MTQEQFDALFERLESFARQQPTNYKLRVGLLAALGYADKELFTQLANEFPSNTYIIFLNNDTKNLEKKLRKIEGAAIYPQKRNNEDIRNTA